jgi:hypothetical protein
MEQNFKSEGKCLYCGKTFVKTGLNRHLKSHIERKSTENPKGKSYLVKVETDPRYSSRPYFLTLWVDGTATMIDIDDLLRGIWLECCEHMSAFTNPANKSKNKMWEIDRAMKLLEQGKQKEYDKLMEESDGDVPMERKVNKDFHKDLKLKYEYDLGSSTCLQQTVLNEFPFKADDIIV